MSSFIRNTGYLLVSVFLMIVVYFVMSGPMEIIFDAFDDTTGDHSDEMDEHLPWIRIAMNMAFSVSIVSGVMWFIFSTFESEPRWDYGDRRRYWR